MNKSCLIFWDKAWWFLSLRVFGLLSSFLSLFPQCFGWYVLWPSSYRLKHCGNNNKDEDNSPKILNDKKSNFIKKKWNIYLPTTLPYFWVVFHLDVLFLIFVFWWMWYACCQLCLSPFLGTICPDVHNVSIYIQYFFLSLCSFNTQIFISIFLFSLPILSLLLSAPPSFYLFPPMPFMLCNHQHSDEVFG